ncbi:MAG TPA: LacI family transcriptional regulator [Tissierellia bacterium]|nr:LacI family transcriptional regulator [Tissierellia bacterium]
MAVTIKDVAKKAGVSISTVSRVINNSKPVSLEVRKKVLDAIKELGYKPNEVARSLVTRRSRLIGVIVTDIGNSYIAEMVRGIEEVGRMYNYDIILSSSYGNKDTEKKFVQLLMSKQVEGIILISEEKDNEVIEEMIGKKIPFIYLNRYYLNDKTTSVSIDNELASFDMTKYILDLGHRNIMYITYDENEEYSIEKYKVAGYNKAMEEGNGEGFVFHANGYRIQDGYSIGQKVLNFAREKSVTCVFCCHDELAIGLMSFFYDNNVKIPEDISVCGFGDLKIASIYRPRLTTVREPYYDIGAVAIRRIIKVINNEKVDKENIYLPAQIMKRESCEKVR